MYTQINPPQKRLAGKVVTVWLISNLLVSGLALIILGVLFYLRMHFDWPMWIHWTVIVLSVMTVLELIWSAFIRPYFLYKNWRYDVTEDFLQLKSGAIFEEEILIPMTKIQSVETSQGPILRKYGLYALTVETIASSHSIPALSEEVAMNLREQIAHFAKVKEVD